MMITVCQDPSISSISVFESKKKLYFFAGLNFNGEPKLHPKACITVIVATVVAISWNYILDKFQKL